MNHQVMLISFIFLATLLFAAFGMQRATLLLSREANTSSQATALLLPVWFPIVWIPRIAKWILLIYIAISWSWWIAIGLALGEIIISSFLPIPYRLYLPIFRRRISQLRQTNTELANALDSLLNASNIKAYNN